MAKGYKRFGLALSALLAAVAIAWMTIVNGLDPVLTMAYFTPLIELATVAYMWFFRAHENSGTRTVE